MATPIQNTVTPAVKVPVQGKTEKAEKFSYLKLHYDETTACFNQPVTSENKFVASITKVANVAMSALTAFAETLRNILSSLFNGAIFPINFVANLVESKKAIEEQEEVKSAIAPEAQEVAEPLKEIEPAAASKAQATEEQEEVKSAAAFISQEVVGQPEIPVTSLLPERTRLQKVVDGTKQYATDASSNVSSIASAVASKASQSLATVKAHPYKTGGVVAGTAAFVGVAAFAGYGYSLASTADAV